MRPAVDASPILCGRHKTVMADHVVGSEQAEDVRHLTTCGIFNLPWAVASCETAGPAS